MARQLNIAFPGSGKEQAYQMEADTPIKFDFDIADAVFSSSGNDLIITVADGGSVILKDYLSLAQEGTLSSFELANGETVPGDVYLFAFSDRQQNLDAVETAADGAAGGSGAGAYSDDPGTLGDGLEALGGQGDAFSSSAPLTAPETTAPALPAEDDATLYPNDEPVQIVLNPSFEASSYRGGTWTYLDDVDHWRNTGGPEQKPHLEDRGFRAVSIAPPDQEDSPMETWGPRMQQTPEDGVRLMELDSVRNSVDQLSQTIATQEGEEVTISFNFSPRVSHLGMDTNNFTVSLGGEEIASILWNGKTEMWDVFTPESDEIPAYSFENNGYVWGEDESRSTDWTELTFTVEAPSDHAVLTFSEFAEHDDSYGTLIDSVTAVRNFHQVLQGSEFPDHLIGSEGDDAIFATDRDIIDGVEDGFGWGDHFVYGGGGDDAIYLAGGQAPVAGGEGDDFLVSGDGSHRFAVGTGNDHLVLGEGNDALFIDQSIMTDGSVVTVEDFSTGGKGIDFINIGIGAHLEDVVQHGEDLHLTIGADNGSEVVIQLLGVSQADIGNSVIDGYTTTEVLSEAIQPLIDSGNNQS